MDDENESNSDDEPQISEEEPAFRVFYDQQEIKETKINQQKDMFQFITETKKKTKKELTENLINIEDYAPISQVLERQDNLKSTSRQSSLSMRAMKRKYRRENGEELNSS